MTRRLLFLGDSALGGYGGWAQRSWHLIEALTPLGQVDIATMSGSPALVAQNHETCRRRAERHVPLLYKDGTWGTRVRRLGLAPLANLARIARRNELLERYLRTAQYDVIIVRLLRSSLHLPIAARRNVIFDVDDTDIEYRDAFGHTRTALRRRSTTNALRGVSTRMALRRVARAWVVNAIYVRSYNFSDATVLPNIPNVVPETFGADSGNALTLVYVGELAGNRTNIASMRFFIAEIFPEILKRRRCTLLLAGAMDDNSPFEGIPGVELVKNPDTLAQVYRRATLAIAPQLSGRGTNIKVVEALAFGRPVVTSPAASRGFEEFSNCGLFVAKSPREFAETCLQLLGDDEYRHRAARAGYEIVKRKYTKAAFAAIVRRSVEEVNGASH